MSWTLTTRALRATRFIPRAAPATCARTMAVAAGVGKGESNVRPPPDQVMQDMADYVHNYDIKSSTAYNTARMCLLDSLGCGIEALRFPAPRAVCGPVVEGTTVPNLSLIHI